MEKRTTLTADEIGLSTDENDDEEEVFDVGMSQTEDDVDSAVAA